ncbi:hypothetical protein [Methylocucumis oryzae]|uniref:hypothetical protein n=1 Tax=Methylocucumis oryzae TaxID=1632867 RepID=UPI001EF9D45E|nr:hypothetical protein [Methylocucumis oryzae]
MRRVIRASLAAGLVLVLSLVFAGHYGQRWLKPESEHTTSLRLTAEQLDRIAKKYGAEAKQRFIAWQDLMASGHSLSESDKLQQVNDFFNRNARFVDDRVLWLKKRLLGYPQRISGQRRR